jgi:pimeloyl-ACP methyl ester carboxylesterase
MPTTTARGNARITLHTADLANGVRLPYAEHGSPDGIPVVLLHGITDSCTRSSRCCPSCPPSFMPTP